MPDVQPIWPVTWPFPAFLIMIEVITLGLSFMGSGSSPVLHLTDTIDSFSSHPVHADRACSRRASPWGWSQPRGWARWCARLRRSLDSKTGGSGSSPRTSRAGTTQSGDKFLNFWREIWAGPSGDIDFWLFPYKEPWLIWFAQCMRLLGLRPRKSRLTGNLSPLMVSGWQCCFTSVWKDEDKNVGSRFWILSVPGKNRSSWFERRQKF